MACPLVGDRVEMKIREPRSLPRAISSGYVKYAIYDI